MKALQAGIALLLWLAGATRITYAQEPDSMPVRQEKQENRIRIDTIQLKVKDIGVQLINLRDSIGVEIMELDKRLVTIQPAHKQRAEKMKSKLSIFKAELEKLAEEMTIADAAYLKELRKRAYHTVLDVRTDFKEILARQKELH